ncbi:MAG: hypothetical protein ACI85I_002331 [Arenicella sp.]|jgi:hypothetical protein
MKILLAFILGLIPFIGFSQNPYHFFLGNEEFATIDIYGLNQTEDGLYWIVSNKGLYSYDGYEFSKYSHKEQLSSSLFNLRIDYEGSVYCNNLNGQIFKMANGEMELYHTVPDSLLGSYTNFEFLTDNKMVVYAKYCYKLVNNKPVILFDVSYRNSSMIKMVRDYDRNLVSSIGRFHIKKITTDTVKTIQLDNPKSKLIRHYYTGFFFHEKGIFISENGTKISRLNLLKNNIGFEEVFIQQNSNPLSVYITKEYFWAPQPGNGIVSFEVPSINLKKPLEPSPILFKSYFISFVFEDNKGNILFGTFGEGIIVIPKTGIVNNLLPQLKSDKIALANNQSIYVADEKGNIYLYNDSTKKKKTVFNKGEGRLDLMKSFPKEEILFVIAGNGVVLERNKVTKHIRMGAVKDMIRVNSTSYLLSDNAGVFKLTYSLGKMARERLYSGKRTYSIALHDEKIALGTSSGLFLLNKKGVILSELTFSSKKTIAFGLEQTSLGLLVSTQNYGLLRKNNNRLEKFIDIESGLLSNSIHQFAVANDMIFIALEKGFQIFDLQGNLLKTVGNSDGLNSVNIKDFAVGENAIWLLHKFGVQKIPLAKLFQKEEPSEFQNIQLYNESQLISESNYSDLAHNQNKIRFKFLAPSLERQKELTYSYFLKGADETWNTHSYEDNSVEYQSLPSGKYTFKVELKYKQNVQDTKEITFVIHKPYWQTWWFLCLFGMVFSLIFYLFFRYRLKVVKQQVQQLNELNASKLAALQSQLNPHFVFNALDSIQNYMLENDAPKAGLYMSKFAKLMRQVLENSREDFIPISEEIKMLENYMGLQQLQSEEKFTYSIQVDEQIELEDFAIPPMFVQPFVENAIEHGVIDGKGNISINFQLEGELVNIVVTDNGIGLSESKKIQTQQAKQHNSLATSIIKERIENYNEKLETNIQLLVSEMVGENQSVVGTKVELKVPFQVG